MSSAGEILIIEDDADIRALECATLEPEGWHVSEASCGADGIEAARRLVPDVILLDRRLPDIDGLEVLAALASDEATELIPVVLVSGMADQSDLVSAIRAGAHDYVVKPFSPVELVVRCRAAAQVSQQRRNQQEQDAALARSEARYQTLLAAMPDTVAVIYDRDLNSVMVAGAGTTARGLDPETMVGKHLTELVAPEDLSLLQPLFEAALEGHASSTEYCSHLTGLDSLLDVVPIGPGEADEILAVARSITTLKQREQALRDAEERWRVAFEAAPVGVALLDRAGNLTRANHALADLLGRSVEELASMTAHELSHPDDRQAVTVTIGKLVTGRVPRLSNEHRLLHADGHAVWAYVSVAALPARRGEPELLTHVIDITAAKQHEDRLRHDSLHDPLTGLLNRRGFDDALVRQHAAVSRYGERAAVLMIDVDGLKQVNDTQGHAAGDDVITMVGDTLRQRLRTTDVIARIGGDEFAAILPRSTAVDAGVVSAAVVSAVRAAGFDVGASVGVAMLEPGRPATVTLADADRAMYAAKSTGGNRCIHAHARVPQT